MSKVSRSVYQKAIEENKRLLEDIKLLTENSISPEKILCISKWRDKFNKEKEFNIIMQQAAIQYLQDHAAELPDFLTKNVIK